MPIPLTLEGGVAAAALEEVGEGPFEVSEALLQNDGGAFGKPGGFGLLLLLGEQPSRFSVAHASPFAVVGVGAKPESPIVH